MLAENIHKRRRVVLALSCVVVFVTTYMLILPAFTLEKTKAAEQGGIDVPGVTTTAEDVSEEDADANDGQADVQDVQSESGKTEDGKVEDSGSKSKDSGETKADSAQTADPLTYEDEHYTIAVDDKNSVLPENTEIKVEEIDKNEDAKKYEKHFDDALAAIQEEKDGENVSDLEFARFYDISLVSDGKEVTLGNGDKVSVNIEYDKELRKALGVENKDNIRIIHFAENKDTGKVEAEVLDNKEAKVTAETTEDNLLKEAAFDAESFSVYGLVCVKEAEEDAAEEKATEETAEKEETKEEAKEETEAVKEEAKADNSSIDLGTAVVSTVDGSDLPGNVDGHADAVSGRKAIRTVKKSVDDLDTTNAKYEVFDIELENVNPEMYKDGFKVDVTLPSIIQGKDFRLFHIHDGEVTELDMDIDTIKANTKGNEIAFGFTFETENFSEFVLSYTVDFEYEGYSFSIPGGSTVKLTDILSQVGVKATDEQITKASFTDEDLAQVYKLSKDTKRKVIVAGSDSSSLPMVAVQEKLSNVQPIEDEYAVEKYEAGTWIFESKAAFKSHEVLNITLENGKEIIINVTDSQNPDGTWDLATSTSSFTVSTNSETNDIDRSASLALDFTYTIKADDLADMKAKAAAGEDVVLVYDFNSALKDGDNNIIAYADEVKNGMIMVGSRQIGTYTIKEGKLTLTVTSHSWLAGRTILSGTFGLSIAIDEDAVENHERDTFEFPGAGDVEVTYKKKVEEAEKTVWAEKQDDGSYILHYSANIKANQNLKTLTFNDTYSGLQTLNSGSVTINGHTVSITENGNSFSISNENLRSALNIASDEKIPAGTYKVEYTTTVTAEDLKNVGDAGTDEANLSKWTADGTDKEKGTETHLKYEEPPAPPIPFEKTSNPSSGTQLSTNGEEITYIIKVGEEGTNLTGLQVTDQMTDLQTLNDGKVYIAYGSPDAARTEMPSSSVKWTNDDNYSQNMSQVFDYTFSGGTGPAYIIYTTTAIDQAKATEKGIFGTVNVGNNANLVNDNQWKSTQHSVPFKEQEKVAVSKTASASNVNANGNWVPGSQVRYELTIGTVVSGSEDESTKLSNMHIWDDMTDVQKLDPSSVTLTVTHPNGTTSTITNVVVNGETVPVSQAIKAAAKDDTYSTNTVNAFDFYLPADAGSGQLKITYNTQIPDAETAKAQGIRDIVNINNTGHGGNGSDGTQGKGEFEPSPQMKVTKLVNDHENTSAEPEEIVTYTVNYGYDKEKKLDGIVIKDEMTDIQKLVLDENGDASIKITVNERPEADIKDSQGNVLLSRAAWDGGTNYFYMPKASAQWNDDGYSWPYFDDDSYSNSNVRVFWYKLPSGLGVNNITVEFQAQMISQAEADNNSIVGRQHAKNKAEAENIYDETDVTVPFNEIPTHYPHLTKVFDHWDKDNNKLYWKIIVEKEEGSAYPLTNVTVSEERNHGWKETHNHQGEYFPDIYIKYDGGPQNGIAGNNVDYSIFDVAHATVTTESGVVLQPNVDYTINKTNASFHFEQLNEKIEILIPVDTPIDPTTGQKVNISNNFEMHNVARVTTDNGNDSDDATEKYKVEEIEANKTSSYDSTSKTIMYTVVLNRDCVSIDPDQTQVLFSDAMDSGMKVLNWTTGEEENPSIFVSIYAENNPGFVRASGEIPVTQTGNKINPVDIVMRQPHNQEMTTLSKFCYTVKYKVSVEDDWSSITSSPTGYKDYENTAKFTAGDEEYQGHTTTRVSGDEYIKKYDTTQESDGFVVDGDGERSATITYKVDINKNREQLNSADNPYLELTDYIATNMELDTQSVKFVKVASDGTKTDITDNLAISYNDNTRLLSARNIPDKEYIVMTFAAVSRAQGTDTYSNTATIIGGGSHSSSVTEQHNISTSYATMGGGNVQINLRKIDENDIKNQLQGAEFKLYECKWSDDIRANDYDKLNRLMRDWKSDNYFTDPNKDYSYISQIFKIDKYEEITLGASESTHGNGSVYITDEEGYISWDNQLSDMKLYCWEEVYAPDGYTGELNVKHYFVVYPENKPNDPDYNSVYNTTFFPWADSNEYIAQSIAWALDNASQKANTDEKGSNIVVASMATNTTWTATNIKSDKTTIEGTKVWEGDSDNLFDTRPEAGILLHLYRTKEDGSEREQVGSPVPINADPDTGEWPVYTWYDLPKYYEEDGVQKEYKYTVTEDAVADYTTTYSDNGEGINSGGITITNKLIPTKTDISVEKVFNPDGQDKPDQILVTLYSINTPIGGSAEAPENTGYSVALSDSNDWKYTFKNLPTRSETGYLTYTVKETVPSGYNYIVTYSDNSEGVSEGTITVTNSLRGSLKIKKNIVGLAAGTELTAAEKAAIEFTVTGPNGYESTFTYAEMTNGEKTIDNLPVGEYTVSENVKDESIPEGYQYVGAEFTPETGNVTVEDSKESEVEITNRYEPTPTEFKFEKEWQNQGSQPVAWPEDGSIKVKVQRKLGDSVDADFELIYDIDQSSFTAGSVAPDTASKAPEGETKPHLQCVANDEVPSYQFTLGSLKAADTTGTEYTYFATEIETSGDFTISYKQGSADSDAAYNNGKIVNKPEDAVELPHTGGIGTVIFYVLGSILVIGGGIYFISRRRAMK